MAKKGKTKNADKITLESVDTPTYEEIRSEIDKKLGKPPKNPKSLPKGNWTEQSRRVLSERYLRKDKNGKVIETPDEMSWRVAWDIASAEVRWGADKREVKKIATEFYNLIATHEFIPNSPTLMNAGTQNGLQYSACFVLPVEDSLIGIFDAIKYQALIHQTGGGTGFAFSRLRPSGSVVKSSMGVASGPVSFMRIFDSATNEIKQGGKRRGANMGILRIDHPDIMEFIHCKDEGGITNFNISVGVTDKFMEAYENDDSYSLIDPRDGKKVGELNAREVFNEIAKGAWTTGDPGVIFLDRMNDGSANPVPSIGPVEATNPCGEQPLYPSDACNLGSIFLNNFVREGKVEWDKLRKVTRLATRFLDNVIEVNPYPLEQIRRVVFAIRRIGLGVGGWADMLVKLGIQYDSEEALVLGRKVMKTIQDESIKESRKLAEERDPFPLWPVSIYKNSKPRRNSTVTTIAPTGSISIIAGASSGIEPLFAIAYQHIVKDKSLDRTLTFMNPIFESVAKERGFLTEELKEKIAEEGVIRNIEEIPQDIRDLFGTAHEIHHDWHIKMQSVFQEYTENAVSKTINMNHDISEDEIKDSYLLAWKTGCKGITVFRDGCKDAQVLNLGVKDREKKEEEVKIWSRPMVISGSTYKIKTPVGTAFITVNQDEKGNPYEVFINVGRAGSDVQAMAEALGRLISKSLKFNSHLDTRERAMVIIDQLRGIGGRRSVGFGPYKVLSLPDAVAIAISNHLGTRMNGNSKLSDTQHNGKSNGESKNVTNGINVGADFGPAEAVMLAPATDPVSDLSQKESKSDHTAALAGPMYASGVSAKAKGSGDICPKCGSGTFVYQEGCAKCFSCAYSEC